MGDTNRFELLQHLTHVEMSVFLELSRRAARDGKLLLHIRSMLDLAKKSGVDTKSTYTALRKLTAKGLIARNAKTPHIVTVLVDLELKLRSSERY